MKRFFTSESVTEGHPDKICDRISDSILDEMLKKDPDARVACETVVTTGMVMVFSVLGLLAVIITLSKVFLYDIPNKKKEKNKAAHTAPAAPATPAPVAVAEEAPAATDDGELAAVITAAIAAMIESGEYKNEFVGGFRVVSFKKSTNSAWNRK